MASDEAATPAASTVESPVVGPADGDALHVMSYNLKYASPKPPHAWPQRRPVMATLLRREQPTVMGTQEGLYEQLKDIARDLPARYDWIGQGRDGGSHGEFSAVFYDRDRLEPQAFDSYWLSRRPKLMGSKSWADTVRMVTWVRFADLRTGAAFVFVNTHFDHVSRCARIRSAKLVRSQVAALAPRYPVLLTGDFNVAGTPAARSYRILTGAGLVDTWLAAEERLTPAYGTYAGYQPPVVGADRIDWILATEQFAVRAAAVNPFAVDDEFPSDHLPLHAVVQLR